MKKILFQALTVMLAVLALSIAPAAAKDKLTKEEAKALMSSMIKDPAVEINIIETAPTQIEGLWEFSVTIQGQPFVVYSDAKGENVIVPPKGLQVFLLNPRTGKVYTQDKLEELTKVAFDSLPLKDSIILGDPKAAIKVAVFDDPY